MQRWNVNRRTLLKQAAFAGGAILANTLTEPGGQAADKLASRIGLELYTLRDIMPADFEGVLAKVAQIGYKEIEPAGGYNNMDAKSFRALLDRYGLSMPSTHTNYPERGPQLEHQLEEQQILGIRYTEIASPAPRRGAPPPVPRSDASATMRTHHNSLYEVGSYLGPQPSVTLDTARRRAAGLNADGKVARKFGIKLFVHNHTNEFERLAGDDRSEYDVLLAETDPELVAMQLDIGWACVSGMDPVQMFHANPGRFELWHVKDVFGIETVNPTLSPNQRVDSMAFTPVGGGQIDYPKIFSMAELAGMKHFAVEQDNAASFGDSLAAASVSFQNLTRMLE